MEWTRLETFHSDSGSGEEWDKMDAISSAAGLPQAKAQDMEVEFILIGAGMCMRMCMCVCMCMHVCMGMCT